MVPQLININLVYRLYQFQDNHIQDFQEGKIGVQFSSPTIRLKHLKTKNKKSGFTIATFFVHFNYPASTYHDSENRNQIVNR